MVGNITFGAWLKRRRRQLDLTQKGLAFRAGCSVGTIRKIEADERRPSRQLATLLAQHLDIPPEQCEAFIAFARDESITDAVSLPILALAEGQVPAIPSIAQKGPAQAVKHNLPAATTPFLGRYTELAALDDLFTNRDRRLVTIAGPGGIGKTRLALAYAEQIVDTAQPPAAQPPYPHGVFFVNLAPLSKAERLILTLAEAVDLRMHGGVREKRPLKQQFLDHLRDRRLLLLLDNFEHLLTSSRTPDAGVEVNGATLVAEILQAAPEVRILVTSRERLNLHMEQVFSIEGLAFPDWETAVPAEVGVEDMGEYTAVQLFLQAARRTQLEFTLETHEELCALVHICRLVGGMPLALELAASWVDTLSLVDIETELQHGLDLLEAELRDVPQRQRSVRATFDYSWRQLDEKEQSVFAQLSIFRGGFTRPAAQAVTGVTLQQLSRLVNKSFIQFNRKYDRYQIHELLRQYGADRLARDSALETGLYDRHSSYYCHALANHTSDLKSAREPQAIYAIEADIENIRLAWNHALSRQDLGSIGASLEPLSRFYENTKIYAGVDEFEKAVAALRTGEAIRERGIVLGRMLACLGNLYHLIEQPARAIEISKESLALLQRLGAREETLMPLLYLAGAQGSLAESKRLLQESLTLAREIGDQWAIGDALLRLANNAAAAGDFEQAEQRGQEALKQFRKMGDRGGIAWALQDLADVAIDRGRYEEALPLARETRSITQEFNFPTLGLYSLGKAMLALEAYEEAQDLFQQGLTFLKEAELSIGLSYGLFQLGKVAFCMGDYARSTRCHQESLAGAVEQEDLREVAQNHEALGRLHVVQGAGNLAREHFQAALQVALPLGRPPILLAILVSVAELLAVEDDLAYAALLAMLVSNHPASQAKIKERGARLLARLEAQLPANDLANIRQRSRQSDLDSVAAQLLKNMKTP